MKLSATLGTNAWNFVGFSALEYAMKKCHHFLDLMLASLVFSVSIPSYASEAHVHGQSQLEIAVEGKQLTLRFESPLDNLTGFEHVPRNERERQILDKAVNILRQANQIYVLPPAAACTPGAVELSSPVLSHTDDKQKSSHHEHEEHGDMDAGYVFSCTNPAALNEVDVRLFEFFPRIKQIAVKFVGPKGQKASQLSGKQSRFAW